MVTIIDYGMGNLRSVQKGFEKVGVEAILTTDAEAVKSASKIVLPGVGAFRDCMDNLNKLNLIDPILEHINSGKPYLGLCLGMQVLFSESDEFGVTKGLDVIKGRVVKFPEEEFRAEKRKIPHMGWNALKIQKETPILNGIADETYVYFVHSFYVKPEDDSVSATKTEYGFDFTSMISYKNVFACQFHPEKSQTQGLKILRNFGDI